LVDVRLSRRSPAGLYDAKAGLALVCPITNQTKGYPFEVAVPAGHGATGVILADHVIASTGKRRADKLGRCTTEVTDEVRARLATRSESSSFRRVGRRTMPPSPWSASTTESPSPRLACLAIASGIRTARLFPHFEIVDFISHMYLLRVIHPMLTRPTAARAGRRSWPHNARRETFSSNPADRESTASGKSSVPGDWRFPSGEGPPQRDPSEDSPTRCVPCPRAAERNGGDAGRSRFIQRSQVPGLHLAEESARTPPACVQG
jgi:hypothetical protein